MIRKLATRLLRPFVRKEEGAVTVDWVVLVAMVIALCMAILAAMSDATLGLSDDIVENMKERPVE